MAEWYYSDGSNRNGPISKKQLLKMIADGTLKKTDYVWNEEMDDWKPVSSIPELNAKPRKSSEIERDSGWRNREDDKTERESISLAERSQYVWRQQEDEEDEPKRKRRSRRSRRDDYDDYNDDYDDYDDAPRGRRRRRFKSDRGVLLLFLSIFSILTSWICCGILGFGFGIPACLIARNDLNLMDRRIMDPRMSGLTFASFVLSIIGIVLSIIILMLNFLFFLVEFDGQ